MSEITAVLATTAIVEQGGIRIRLSREAIESTPEQIAGDSAIPMIVNHDPFSLPIGKIKDAWVEPLESELAAVVRIHIEDDPSIEKLRSGIELIRLDFEDDQRPFKRDTRTGTLAVDQANFNNMQDYSAFAKDVSHIDGEITCSNEIGRRALTPEPLVQFVVNNPEMSAALAWILLRLEGFVRYTVDETLRKVADDISDSLSEKLKNILKAYGKRRSNDNRPTVTKIIIPGGDTELTLLVKTEHGEEFPAIDLGKLTTEMEKYGELLQEADCATFARVGVNDWEFLYLTTRSGKVFGTLECHKRTLDLLRSMRKDRDSGAEEASQED